MDGNLTMFSVGIIVQFGMQYNKFDIFRHSQALSYAKSRPDILR